MPRLANTQRVADVKISRDSAAKFCRVSSRKTIVRYLLTSVCHNARCRRQVGGRGAIVAGPARKGNASLQEARTSPGSTPMCETRGLGLSKSTRLRRSRPGVAICSDGVRFIARNAPLWGHVLLPSSHNGDIHAFKRRNAPRTIPKPRAPVRIPFFSALRAARSLLARWHRLVLPMFRLRVRPRNAGVCRKVMPLAGAQERVSIRSAHRALPGTTRRRASPASVDGIAGSTAALGEPPVFVGAGGVTALPLPPVGRGLKPLRAEGAPNASSVPCSQPFWPCRQSRPRLPSTARERDAPTNSGSTAQPLDPPTPEGSNPAERVPKGFRSAWPMAMRAPEGGGSPAAAHGPPRSMTRLASCGCAACMRASL